MNNEKSNGLQLSLASFLEFVLQGVQFGSVEITVHDGRVVQIERRETFRPHEARFRATPPDIK